MFERETRLVFTSKTQNKNKELMLHKTSSTSTFWLFLNLFWPDWKLIHILIQIVVCINSIEISTDNKRVIGL
jgi:hypothetical protein